MVILETDVFFTPQVLGWAYFKLSDDANEWGIYHAYTAYRMQLSGIPDLMTSVPLVGGRYPGIGVVNSSTYSRTTFLFEVYDADGKAVKTFTKTVDPLHLEWFSLVHENLDLAAKRGQIKVSGGLFGSAVFTLQFAPNGAFTGLPVVRTYGMR